MVKTASALTAALANTSVTTIYVAAGEYVGNFTIGRNLTLIGAGKDKTIITPPTGTNTNCIEITADNIPANQLFISGIGQRALIRAQKAAVLGQLLFVCIRN